MREPTGADQGGTHGHDPRDSSDTTDASGTQKKNSEWEVRGARHIGVGLVGGGAVGVVIGLSAGDLPTGLAIGVAAGSSVGAAVYLRRPPTREEVPGPVLESENQEPDTE